MNTITVDQPAGVEDEIRRASAAILEAYASGVPCAPVRTLLPDNDVGAAYRVQREQVHHWLEQGRRIVGRKIGLTAKAVQKQLGVDQPDFGILFADMCLGDDEQIAAGAVLQPKVEGEIALILDRDLAMECPTVADVVRATAYVVPAIEIVGSRIANWDIRIVDTVADNASAGLFALGGPARRIDGLDLVGCAMALTRNGTQASQGTGAACLGSPLNAATWLARKMIEVNSPLAAGDIIMTGALGPMVPAAAGDRIELTISGLGSARTNFA
jgi:2-keto-4-pentenoate hydratase